MFPVEKAARNTEDPDRQMNSKTINVSLIIMTENSFTDWKVLFWVSHSQN